MHDELGLPEPPEEIIGRGRAAPDEVYAERLPLIDGAVRPSSGSLRRWPLGLASVVEPRGDRSSCSSLSGLARLFRVTVSLGRSPARKPAPDVYLEAARRPRSARSRRCAAVEDSHNGIRSAKAAGDARDRDSEPALPARRGALALADVTLGSLAELTPSIVE